MSSTPFNLLFLCTGNSARSIMAEVTLNHLAAQTGRFHAYSAGSFPKSEPNPLALALMAQQGISTVGVRSKRWDEFLVDGAPPIHLVVTVCDAAAGEACPLYPGTPPKTHWGVPDPHTAAEFEQAYRALRQRIERFIALPIEALTRAELQQRANAIGQN